MLDFGISTMLKKRTSDAEKRTTAKKRQKVFGPFMYGIKRRSSCKYYQNEKSEDPFLCLVHSWMELKEDHLANITMDKWDLQEYH